MCAPCLQADLDLITYSHVCVVIKWLAGHCWKCRSAATHTQGKPYTSPAAC
jgi:hypothetical protein